MKNKLVLVGFALFLSLLILGSARAELTTSVENITPEGGIGEILEYKLNFHNMGSDEMFISIFVVADVSPDSFVLLEGGKQSVYIKYTIPSSVSPGTLFVPIKLFDKDGAEYPYSIILQGQVLEPEYPFSSVRMSEIGVFPDFSDAETPFSVSFVMTGVPKITTASVIFESPFELTYPRALPLFEGRNEVTISDITIPKNAAPGKHDLKIIVSFNDGTILQKYFSLNVEGYSQCEVEPGVKSSFTEKRYVATVSNIGSAESVCSVSTRLTSMEKMLISEVTEGYSYMDGKIEWEVLVPAGKTVTVEYSVSYLPLLVLPFIIIILCILVWYFSRKMDITRELVSHKLYHGFMDMKIQIHVRNLSNQSYKHVQVKEPLGAYVKEVKEFGTAEGDVVTEKKKRLVVWEIDEIKPKEERVFSYKIRTSVEVLGQLNFAPTTVEYVTAKGERRKETASIFSVEID